MNRHKKIQATIVTTPDELAKAVNNREAVIVFQRDLFPEQAERMVNHIVVVASVMPSTVFLMNRIVKVPILKNEVGDGIFANISVDQLKKYSFATSPKYILLLNNDNRIVNSLTYKSIEVDGEPLSDK